MIVGLSFEIANAVVGDKERSDGAVGVVRDEAIITSVEFSSTAFFAFCFEDVFTGVGVTKLLSSLEILFLGDIAEFFAVFGEMLLQHMLRAEATPPRDGEERGDQRADDDGNESIAWQ